MYIIKKLYYTFKILKLYKSVNQQKKVYEYMDKLAVKRSKIDENDGNFIYELPLCYAGWVPPSSIDN